MHKSRAHLIASKTPHPSFCLKNCHLPEVKLKSILITMLKFGHGPSGSYSEKAWDHKGKTEIAQIIVSRSETRINLIYFLFVEDGGNKLVMSEKIGGGGGDGGTISLNTFTLDYPHEVITGVTGKYEIARYGHTKSLRSITIVTNKIKYGPIEVSPTDSTAKEIGFEYYVGEQFGGFFGTFTSAGIETIGVYMKPLDKLPNNSVKKE